MNAQRMVDSIRERYGVEVRFTTLKVPGLAPDCECGESMAAITTINGGCWICPSCDRARHMSDLDYYLCAAPVE